jgi:hypothetical protein
MLVGRGREKARGGDTRKSNLLESNIKHSLNWYIVATSLVNTEPLVSFDRHTPHEYNCTRQKA